MAQYKIEYTKNPATSDIDFLTKQINQETSEYGEAYPFAFFIRDDAAEIIAGANGFVIYGAIYTDQLWVNKDYRGQGFAKKIKQKIFEHSRNKFPKAKVFSITTGLAVMKMNSDLGYKPVTFSELTDDQSFWKGCQTIYKWYQSCD